MKFSFHRISEDEYEVFLNRNKIGTVYRVCNRLGGFGWGWGEPFGVKTRLEAAERLYGLYLAKDQHEN